MTRRGRPSAGDQANSVRVVVTLTLNLDDAGERRLYEELTRARNRADRVRELMLPALEQPEQAQPPEITGLRFDWKSALDRAIMAELADDATGDRLMELMRAGYRTLEAADAPLASPQPQADPRITGLLGNADWGDDDDG